MKPRAPLRSIPGGDLAGESLEFGIDLLSSMVTELHDLADEEDLFASKLPLPHGENYRGCRKAAAAFRVAADRIDRDATWLRREERCRQPPTLDLRGLTP